MPNSTTFISIQDAAAHLAVSPKTVRRMISRGDLRAVRLGSRLIRVPLEQLEHVGRPLAA